MIEHYPKILASERKEIKKKKKKKEEEEEEEVTTEVLEWHPPVCRPKRLCV